MASVAVNIHIILENWKEKLAKDEISTEEIVESLYNLVSTSKSTRDEEVLFGLKEDMLITLFSEIHIINKLMKMFIADHSKSSTSLKNKFFSIQQDCITDTLFLYLVEHYKTERDTSTLLFLYDNIVYHVEHETLIKLFWNHCEEKPMEMRDMKPIFSPALIREWDNLIQKVVSLPDIVCNKIQIKKHSPITSSLYYATISNHLNLLLKKIHESIQNSVECNVVFCSRLMSKLCAVGQADIVMRTLLPMINEWIYESPLLRRICSKLFEHISDSHLEKVLDAFLVLCDSPNLLIQLFGDGILRRDKLKFLLSHKYLFIKFYQKDIVPYNILGYLSSKQTLEDIFKQVVFDALEVWSSASALDHSSYEQHHYISRVLLIASSFFTQDQISCWRNDIILKLMNGVQAHLHTPNEKLHQLAMVVAECITKHVDKNGKQLKFELELTDDIVYLQQLSLHPQTAIKEKKSSLKNEKKDEVDIRDASVEKSVSQAENLINQDLDSDDDLEPINPEEVSDNDNDSSSVDKIKAPHYLRECISGLLASKDANRQEICLKTVEKLIKKEPGDLKYVAVEIIKVLLNLQDQYNFANFDMLRFNAMVAVIVRCPVQTCEYLCQQFYEENYSINQRLDILQVLQTSAKILSSPTTEDADKYRSHLPLTRGAQEIMPKSHEKPEWQLIVDKRIRKKTRYKSTSSSSKLPQAVKNEFSPVAGLFFFPLLKDYGRRLDTCDLFGNDSIVLANLIHTLATVVECSSGLQIVESMSHSLFEVIWSLRYHKQSLVRQALLYSVAIIFQYVQPSVLVSVLQSDVSEANDWLNEVVLNDPSSECKRLAVSCLKFGHEALNKAFGNPNG